MVFNQSYHSFNSTLVQLKDGCLLGIPFIIHRFNSTLVQLKVEKFPFLPSSMEEFQFYLSSIKSYFSRHTHELD